MKNLGGISLAAAAAVAAILVPLYGDPRQGTLTHPQWARMLLGALELDSALPADADPSLAFQMLSWRTTFRMSPDRPFRQVAVEFLAGPPRAARATSPGAELAYRFAVARTGEYRVRLQLGGATGDVQAPPVAIEITPDGETKPTKSLSFAPTPLVESPGIHLSPGVYTLVVGLPVGPSLEALEIVPPCLNSIEPKGGWQRTAITQTGDVAVTLLQASDLESELPPAATAVEVASISFRPTTGQMLRASTKGSLDGEWLRGEVGGLNAIAHVTLDEPGLYTVYGYGLAGGGQSWLVDACLKSVVCPTAERPESPGWRPLMTAYFSSGLHSFSLTLANEAALQRLKIERKKDAVLDYLGTLRRLGVDLGAPRPVTRGQAADALKFLAEKRRLSVSKCDDVLLPSGALVAGLAMPGGTVGTSAAIPPGPPNAPTLPLPGPSASPIITTSPSPSPISTPSPSGSPSPSPSPSASPSLGPPPTTVAQPPASPIKD